MWVVRAYNPADDEMLAEHEMPSATRSGLSRVIGVPPSLVGSTRLSRSQVTKLADACCFPVDATADYFLDFDFKGFA